MPEAKRYFAVLAASLLLAGFGCGGKDQPVKTEGIVTLDGEPVEGAIVSFLPDEGPGRFAHGTTAKDGSFRLTTYKQNDGALPGDYRVTVTLIPDDDDEDEAKAEAPGQEKALDGKEQMAAMVRMAQAKAKALERSPIPALYREAGRTPLRQIVPASGKVTLALKREQPQERPAKTAPAEAKPADHIPAPQGQPARP
jgi:hypothetical protein